MKKSKITIKDIAEMAGTSKTTVSFYLNGKTEKCLKKQNKELNR
ncbi:MAG: LacI family DNA-binding transcriptional regulator [Coprobacillus cateniformis]